MKNDEILILAFRFNDNGEPQETKNLHWRMQDIKTNIANIHSLLTTEDEVLLIDKDDYNIIMHSGLTDTIVRHNHLRSYSINIYAGENA